MSSAPSSINDVLAAYVAGREQAARVVAVVADAYYREAGKGRREVWRPVMDVIERAAPGLVELVGAPGRPGFEIRLAQRAFPKEFEPALRAAIDAVMAGARHAAPLQNPGAPLPTPEPQNTGLLSRVFRAVRRLFSASA
jgi:hypothetical protein